MKVYAEMWHLTNPPRLDADFRAECPICRCWIRVFEIEGMPHRGFLPHTRTGAITPHIDPNRCPGSLLILRGEQLIPNLKTECVDVLDQAEAALEEFLK